jgi:hypothetical protein
MVLFITTAVRTSNPTNSRIVSRIGYYRFLPDPFQFILQPTIRCCIVQLLTASRNITTNGRKNERRKRDLYVSYMSRYLASALGTEAGAF